MGSQDTIDQHLRDTQRPPVMQAQFGGTLATRIVCRGVPYRSEKDEDFVQVRLFCPNGESRRRHALLSALAGSKAANATPAHLR